MKLNNYLMIKSAYSKYRENYLDRFAPSEKAATIRDDRFDKKPIPTHANPEDYKGPVPFAWPRYVLDEKSNQDLYQSQMRDYDFRHSPEYPELYRKSRLPNGLVVGGLGGAAGLAASKLLTNKFGLTGWKKWLAHGLLGGGGALAGAYFGSKLGPRMPDEYKNRYYNDNGDRIN